MNILEKNIREFSTGHFSGVRIIILPGSDVAEEYALVESVLRQAVKDCGLDIMIGSPANDDKASIKHAVINWHRGQRITEKNEVEAPAPAGFLARWGRKIGRGAGVAADLVAESTTGLGGLISTAQKLYAESCPIRNVLQKGSHESSEYVGALKEICLRDPKNTVFYLREAYNDHPDSLKFLLFTCGQQFEASFAEEKDHFLAFFCVRKTVEMAGELGVRITALCESSPFVEMIQLESNKDELPRSKDASLAVENKAVNQYSGILLAYSDLEERAIVSMKKCLDSCP